LAISLRFIFRVPAKPLATYPKLLTKQFSPPWVMGSVIKTRPPKKDITGLATINVGMPMIIRISSTKKRRRYV
jgi:hypothetical protein